MKFSEINEELENEIIRVAYRDSSFVEYLKIMWLIKKNPTIRNIYDSYKNTFNEVRKIKEEETPNYVLEKVKTKINTQVKRPGIWDEIYFSVFSKPLLSMAIIVIIVGAVVLSALRNQDSKRVYSMQEIETADIQARQALAVVGKIFAETNSTLKTEILTQKVSKPIHDGITVFNNLFEGEKNENN